MRGVGGKYRDRVREWESERRGREKDGDGKMY